MPYRYAVFALFFKTNLWISISVKIQTQAKFLTKENLKTMITNTKIFVIIVIQLILSISQHDVRSSRKYEYFH